MDFNFDYKTALITGAASGIGRSTAVGLAAHGARVVLVDNNADSGTALERELNSRFKGCALFSRADVSDLSTVQECIRRSGEEFGGIDLLAHCAGIQSYGSVTGTTPENWSRTLATNLDSAFYLARAVIPGMKQRRSGSIVLIGSTQSLVAQRNSAAYVTGKHAIVGLMRSIAVDCASAGVRANCVLPGAIDTPMVRQAASLDPNPQRVIEACNSLSLLGRMGTPEEVADVILFC